MKIYVEDLESRKEIILSNISSDLKISEFLKKVKKNFSFQDENEKFLITNQGEVLNDDKSLKEFDIEDGAKLYYGIQNKKQVLFQDDQIKELKGKIQAFKYDKEMIYQHRIANEKEERFKDYVVEWKKREQEYENLIIETTKKLELLTEKSQEKKEIEKKKEKIVHDKSLKYLELIEKYQKEKENKMKKIHPKTETLVQYFENRYFCQGTDVTFHLFSSENLKEKHKLSEELLQDLNKDNDGFFSKAKYWKMIAALCGMLLLTVNEKTQVLIDDSWTFAEMKYIISKKTKIPLHNIIFCLDKSFIIEEKNEKFINSLIRTCKLKE